MEELLPIVLEVGEVNLDCMALLDRANTETFGNPRPVQVSLTVEKGPFIVISGHDLYDLKLLLEQTAERGSISTPTGNASGPRLSGAQKVFPFKGSFRHGLAESAEGICRYSRAGSFHHQLPDAPEGQL